MSVVPSSRIGPYEVISPIGAGGMGEVWKARDTRLDRIVAIKFVKGEFGERFEREARAVAALNHPGICTLHDIGPDYLVMEYVDGKPLQGPLPLPEALRLAILIAEALDAAHRRGIVHRDLKPANILVTKSGVKLLDFGLAKFQGGLAADGQTLTTTQTMALTGKGEILGTLHYMSPEQVQGKDADTRSDIFSFGLVLYEMLSGRRAFRAENPASLVAAILKDQPEPVEALALVTPPSLSRLISRSLQKDPDQRWQSVRDMIWEMESIQLSPAEAPIVAGRARGLSGWRPVAASILLTAAVCGALFRWSLDAPDGTIAKTSIAPLAAEAERETHPLFSPDGKSIVYVRDGRELVVRSASGQNPALIADCSLNCWPAAWSPDCARVYYFDGGDLAVTAATGGTAQVVTKSVRSGATLSVAVSPDNHAVVFGHALPDGRWELVVSSPPGADPKPLAGFRPTRGRPFMLRFSPDGRKIAASMVGELVVAPFPGGQSSLIEVVGNTADVDWLPDSRHIVYTRVLASTKEVVLRDTDTRAARLLLRSEQNTGGLSISPDGTRMAYQSGTSKIGIMEAAIESGVVRTLLLTRVMAQEPQYAPSGDRYVYSERSTGRTEIFAGNLNGSSTAQLTFGNPVTGVSVLETRSSPTFSRDGRRIAFSQSGQIWTLPATGGQSVPVTPAGQSAVAPAWSPDGRWIFYQRGLSGKRELAKIDSAGQGNPVTVSERGGAPSVYTFTRTSANGLVAYGLTGKGEVRLCSADGTGDRALIEGVQAGDFDPRGERFCALKREGQEWKLLTIDVSTGRVLQSVVLQGAVRGDIRAVSVHPDGKRLAYSATDGESDIWLLEGIPRPATGWRKLLGHWIEP